MGIVQLAKPPVNPKDRYVHQEYPKTLFNRDAHGKVIMQSVKDKPTHDNLAKGGWVESPADLSSNAPAPVAEIDQEQLDTLLDENEQLKKELAELKAAKGKAGKADKA